MITKEGILDILGKHPRPKPLAYGTSGFRSNAAALEEAVLRCGIVAACRSHSHDGRAVGAMVTASHNPPADNGVKLVEPDGSMLSSEWEPVATSFVNLDENPLSAFAPLIDVDDLIRLRRAVVVVGRDTRSSSPSLSSLLERGVKVVGGIVINIGQVTTPQLHIAVRAYNQNATMNLDDYFANLSCSFKTLIGRHEIYQDVIGSLVIDCANGVGALAVEKVSSLLQGVKIVNKPGEGPLNDKCGADYVQKNLLMPKVYGEQPNGEIWASLDGDADRLVIYRPERNGHDIILADGDRFAALVVSFITEHLNIADISNLSIAVAQTAYSNGAVTHFLSSLGSIEIVTAKTGVKHLEKAIARFDIGVYWEPNGHGTVLFNDNAIEQLKHAYDAVRKNESQVGRMESINALLSISKLANQTVGDGVADLLLVIAILSRNGMTFDDWMQMYDERCSCNMIVHVANKSVILTADCDRRVEKPAALRDAIANISSDEGCRAFVRPSGTEDVVRVYAEAPAQCDGKAKEMARSICRAVYDYCQGVGNRP